MGRKNTSQPDGSLTSLGWFGLWYSKRNPLLRFGLKFCLLFIPFDALSIAPWSDKSLTAFLSVYAHVSNWILVMCGQNSHVTGSTISGQVATISIMRGCDALDPMLVLFAGILAYPASWRRKAIGLVFGLPMLFVLNVVRILSLYFIELKALRFFEPAHLDIWPVIFVILAGLLWFAWMRWTLRGEDCRHAAA
jgi:exosortase H (IPTLxxWG-CTERM-specific)